MGHLVNTPWLQRGQGREHEQEIVGGYGEEYESGSAIHQGVIPGKSSRHPLAERFRKQGKSQQWGADTQSERKKAEHALELSLVEDRVGEKKAAINPGLQGMTIAPKKKP